MHRDHKLGLALGVLVIGFAAALCFPRQPAGTTASLELKDPAQLDAGIELLPVRAYTDADAGRTPRERATPDGVRAADSPEAALPGSGSASAELELFAGPPEPIRPVADRTGPPVPDPSAWPPVAPGGEARPSSSPPAAADEAIAGAAGAASTGMRYTVRSGDTLSGLAARFLGSTQRYLEIYEANRDVLESPNAIRAGLELTIPVQGAAKLPEGVSASGVPVRLAETIDDAEPADKLQGPVGHNAPRQERPGTDDAPAARFRPAGRSPFLPGPARPGSGQSPSGPRPASRGNGE